MKIGKSWLVEEEDLWGLVVLWKMPSAVLVENTHDWLSKMLFRVCVFTAGC